MKTLRLFQALTIISLFFFSLSLSASSIKIIGSYSGVREFNTDTIYVIGDCYFYSTFIIHPGTRVIFRGDYLLRVKRLHAKGTVGDSIYFFPENITGVSYKGKLDLEYYTSADTTQCCVFRDLSSVKLENPIRCKIINCSYVSNSGGTYECFITFCRGLVIYSKILNSVVTHVNSIVSRSTDNTFIINNCLFEHNYGTMSIPVKSAFIDENNFRNNYVTPIEINGSIQENVFITNNCFYNNNSYYLAGALSISNSSGAYILNNTFFNNNGTEAKSLFSSSLSGISLKNNIFWNSDSTIGTEIKLYTTNNTPLITANIIRGGLSGISTENYGDEFEIFAVYPDFIDSLYGSNLELTKNSPAINRGCQISLKPWLGSIDEDLDHSPRVFGKSVDIGAYEYIPTTYPEIEYYMRDTVLFTGDSMIMKIQTNDFYDYSWFQNDSLIVGQKDTCLIISSVGLKHSGEYKVRVCNLSDTLWSIPVRVGVYPWADPLFPDTSYYCGSDALILSTGLTGCRFEWSTGDTTSTIQVAEPGNYWVQITAGALPPVRYPINVDYFPRTFKVAGQYSGTQHWCSDTIVITGDCYYTDSLIINAGTYIIFNGDYTFTANWTMAKGTSPDSIWFTGISSSDDSKQGEVITYVNNNNGLVNNNEIENLVFSNLKQIKISGAMYSAFRNCSNIRIFNPHGCQFLSNEILEIEESIAYCTVEHTGYLSGLNPESSSNSSFDIVFSSFRENTSPFYLNSGFNYLSVRNSIFESNTATAIRSNYPSRVTQIANNLFFNNSSVNGPGALNLMLFGNYSPIIFNNTFYQNTGVGSQCMYIENFSSGNIELLNNILWGNGPGSGAQVAFVGNPFDTAFVTNTILQGGMNTIETEYPQYFEYENISTLYPGFSDTIFPSIQLELEKNSPAINSGAMETKLRTANGQLNLFHDLNNQPRVFGKSVDIGAYEYIPEEYPEFIELSSDTIICYNSPITLKAFSNDHFYYQWYRNDVLLPDEQDDSLFFHTITEKDTGLYQVSISNLSNTVWSHPIHLDYADAPIIMDYTPINEVCMNDEAEFTIHVKSDNTPLYRWFSKIDGEVNESSNVYRLLHARQSDTLFAIASLNYCTDTTGNMLLTVFQLPQPILGTDTALYPGDSILLDAGTFESYEWSTGSHDPEIYAEGSDTVWVIVSDENGCSGSDTIVISVYPVFISLTDDNLTLLIYPNPAHDRLYFNIPADVELPCLIKIISQDGRIISENEVNSNDKQLIHAESLEKGLYFLTMQSAGYSGIGKFIIE